MGSSGSSFDSHPYVKEPVMKKILSVLCLALFLSAGLIGCSSSSTSGTGTTGSPKGDSDKTLKAGGSKSVE